MAGLKLAYAADITIREADEKLASEAIATQVEEFGKDGIVYEKNGVSVTAFEVDHGDFIKPAYGFRIDYSGHSAEIKRPRSRAERVPWRRVHAGFLLPKLSQQN